MERDDWYRNRILWKAEQHKLFDKKCCKFSDLLEGSAAVIKGMSGDIEPVIVFWDSQDKWTALGTKKVCSFYDGNLVCSGLDEIDQKLSIVHPPEVQPDNIKLESNFIKLDALDKLIWAPAGSELFALMNILQMFPLAEKNVA